MAKIKGKSSPSLTCPIILREIIKTLFPPEDEPNMVVQRTFKPDEVPAVREDEVLETESSIGQKKAFGPDGIPN